MGLLKWALVFLVLAGVAAVFGVGWFAEGATEYARVLGCLFLGICALLFVLALSGPKAAT